MKECKHQEFSLSSEQATQSCPDVGSKKTYMWVLGNRIYESLEDAVDNASKCKYLRLISASQDLENRGADFLKLRKLKRLHIQADSSIFESTTFALPREIGDVLSLTHLGILNIPLKVFPEWILQLTNLRYLAVRGNDITSIPEDIIRLNKLERFRIENCPLSSLPVGLRKMDHLKYLGLCDTRLIELDISMFPSKLKELDFSGTGWYKIEQLRQIRAAMKGTKVYPAH
jgi:Leucine-rich repeat (LRR) protein